MNTERPVADTRHALPLLRGPVSPPARCCSPAGTRPVRAGRAAVPSSRGHTPADSAAPVSVLAAAVTAPSGDSPEPPGACRMGRIRSLLFRRVPPGLREAGLATAEYAIVTLAAVGFAALLAAVLSSGELRAMLMSLITNALSFG